MGFFNSILFVILPITFLFYQSIFHLPIVSAKDTLMPGDELHFNYTKDSSSSTLSSSNGKFTLGFFPISTYTLDANSDRILTYLEIWYTNKQGAKRVWVANRDLPILDAAILIIDDSGILKVKSENGTTLFNVSDNKVGSSNNTRAMLQDSGNFIVYDEANRIIWQSFDYPTDTLIPGMKLGYNLTTMKNWELTSAANFDVPTSGAFTMRLEQYQNLPRLLIYRHGELYWASGPWNKSTGTFQMLLNDLDFNMVFDPSGMYLIVKNTSTDSMPTLQLYPNGRFDEGDFCDGYQGYGYEWCVDSALPHCRVRALASGIDFYGWERSGFAINFYNWESRDIYKTDDNSSISLGDCMEKCWNDCTCTACSTYNNNGTGCIYWTEQNLEIADIFEEGSNQIAVYALLSEPKTKDVLMPGDVLDSFNSNATLVSANGNFTLGFSTFISSTTNFTYLGIWYASFGNGVGNGSIVWVANRDNPMTGSGTLMMDDLGSLKVVNGSGATLFNVFNNSQVGSGNNTNTRGLLQDSGNFLVYDATDNRTLWQSFDHPTDTLLPGMKIGYNHTTGQNWTLISWLSDVTPATGAFTMRLEQYQNSPQLVIYRRGEVYRASGPLKNGTSRVLDSLNFFNFPPGYNQSLIFDASGMYFTYQANNFMFQLAPDGHVNDNHSPTPRKDFCYGYKSYDGCAVSEMPNCRGQRDSFVLKSGDWTFGPSNNDVNSSISLSDCMERCWNDCNCVGFITINSNGTGCITWVTNNTNKDVRFQDDPFGTKPQKYVLVSKKPVKIKRWMLIVVPLASAVLSILAVYLCYVRIRRRRLEEEEIRRRDDILHQLVGSNSFNYGDELERGIKDAPDVKVFSLKAIMAATSNFSNENKLGQGGYGPVYKGKLPDGREIAVKRLSKTSGQGIKEFKNELILISKLQHTNLVRLYGCCIHQEEKMLIYEFMPNKSLDFFLFDDDKKVKIDWRIRFNIIEGIAQGLLYLHRYSRMRVIHRDLKVSNILLDQNMNPKIADFGLARIFQQDVSEEMTKRVVGTYGYMAPEYAMHGTFSVKSDVFSFGVLILEIVNGKKNSSFYKYDMPLNLLGYAWELWKREATLELKDEALSESYDVKQLLRAIHIGLLCVQENANDRPTISEVISMLNNEITDLPIPKQPAFFMHPDEVQQSRPSEHLLGHNIQGSVNGLTITTMQAR